jgi:hypothetical protein
MKIKETENMNIEMVKEILRNEQREKWSSVEYGVWE